MKILITGGAGNIGSVLANRFLAEGYEVVVVDILWFDKRVPLSNYHNPDYTFIRGDIRDQEIMERALEGVDFVIHAAAVVGDPASKKYPELTRDINENGTKKLIEQVAQKGVKGFFFFSTCSNYGIARGLATEETELNPLSIYAETKVNIEQLLAAGNHGIDWLIGRFSTVYGSSSRMRFDLTVNDFTMTAFHKRELDIFFPESFRPYIHTFDLSNVILRMIQKFDQVKNNVFNVGFLGENYQKIKIAKIVQKHIPGTKINIVKEGGDMRDYQVDFSKLDRFLGLKNKYDVEKAVVEMLGLLENGIINDFDNPIYYNTTPDIQE